MLQLRVGSISCLPILLLTAPGLQAQSIAEALVRADREFAQLSSDSGFQSSARSVWGPDGVLLWPGAPVILGADLGTFFQINPTDSVRLAWQPLGVNLSADSTTGSTWGVVVTTSRAAPLPPQLGRYIAAWTRQSSRWMLAALAFIGVDEPRDPRWQNLPLTRNAARPSGRAADFIAADLRFARVARDSGAGVAFRRYAADDALSFGGGSLLVRGPGAISRAVSGPARWNWHPVAAGAAPDRSFGWTVGEAVITSPEGEAYYSKYLTVWVRSRDGRIRFIYDGGNRRPSPR